MERVEMRAAGTKKGWGGEVLGWIDSLFANDQE